MIFLFLVLRIVLIEDSSTVLRIWLVICCSFPECSSTGDVCFEPPITFVVSNQLKESQEKMLGKKRSRDDDKGSLPMFVRALRPPPAFASPTITQIEGGPLVPFTFDVSKLLPVKRSSAVSKESIVIELLDKGTNQVIVCFRGITNCHQALGLDPDTVIMACMNHDSPSQPDLGSYILR